MSIEEKRLEEQKRENLRRKIVIAMIIFFVIFPILLCILPGEFYSSGLVPLAIVGSCIAWAIDLVYLARKLWTFMDLDR